MKKSLKIALISRPNEADPHAASAAQIAEAAEQGAQLICMQELHDGPYFCQCQNVENFALAENFDKNLAFYADLAKKHRVVIVTSLYERALPGLYYNTAVVLEADGSVAGKYRKMHIPDDPHFYEKFYFAPGDLGFCPIDTSLGRLGVLVCWDQWYPEAARLMALAGAQILIYPTAIGWLYERGESDEPAVRERQREAWLAVQRGHAVANALPVVGINRVGFEHESLSGRTSLKQTGDFGEDASAGASEQKSGFSLGAGGSAGAAVEGEQKSGIDFWGSSFVYGPQGEEIFMQPANSAGGVFVVELDLAACEQVRQWWPFLRDRRTDAFSGLTSRQLV